MKEMFIFVPATSSSNRLVSDNNSCLDNPVGQASFLWTVAAWCRCLPIGLFYFKKQRHNEPPHLHFAPIPAHLSPAISTAGSTYSVSFIS